MRRALGVLGCLTGLVWGGMIGWAINRPETEARTRARSAVFVVMIGSIDLIPAPTRQEDTPPEEEW